MLKRKVDGSGLDISKHAPHRLSHTPGGEMGESWRPRAPRRVDYGSPALLCEEISDTMEYIELSPLDHRRIAVIL